MPSAAHRVHYSKAEYVAFERSSNAKHEYLGGQIYAMAGGSPEHAALAAAFVTLVGPRLRGGRCRVHSSDLCVAVLATGLATYPDVTVVCGPRELDPDDKHAVTNPTVVVEVLSPSTEEYDRGEKLEHYARIPSLREVVLVAHDGRRVEVHARPNAAEAFVVTVAGDGEMARIPSLGVEVDVRELYDVAAEPG